MKSLPPIEQPTLQELSVPASTEPTRERGATLRQRVLLLLACLALGLGAGFVGLHFTSSAAWFLAIPICLALGWFLVADPTACTATHASRDHDKRSALG